MLWSALLIGLFLHLQTALTLCSKATLVDTFVSVSIAFFLLTVLIEFAIIMASLRGTLVQTEGNGRDHQIQSTIYLLYGGIRNFSLGNPNGLSMFQREGYSSRMYHNGY